LIALGVLLAFGPETLSHAAVPPASFEFLIDVWDTERGLPHSTVTSIAQTPDGYLWVGTLHGGLARFDGVRFVSFHPGNTPEMQSIEVQRLLVDVQGTLWIAMVEGILLSYREGHFHFERQDTTTPQSWLHSLVVNRPDQVTLSTFGGWLSWPRREGGTNRWETVKPPDADSLSAFCEAQDGRILYRTHDAGLGVYADGQFSRVPTDCGLASLTVHALARDPAGHIWVGTDKEIAEWDGQRFINRTPANGPPEMKALQLAFAGDGSLWVRTDTALRKCIGGRWVAQALPWEGKFALTMRPLEMRADGQGGVWLAHFSDGLWHVNADGQVARISDAQGLPSNQVECWFQDREGNAWAGLAGGGLVRLRRRSFQTVWPEGEAREQAARSICEDASGAMWFGTSGETFLRWRDGEFSRVVPPVTIAPGRDGTVWPDAAGRVWLGSVLNGVWVQETNQLWRPFPPERPGIATRAIFGDSRDRIWFGNEFGLFVWDHGQRQIIAGTEGFAPVFVTAITEDNDGHLWLGSANGELYRYDRQAGECLDFRPKDGSAVVRFWALLADDDGVIWVGTLGGGLLRFKDGKFARYTTREGLPNDHVSQILEGPRGELWLGTRAGIARVRKQDLAQFAAGELKTVPCITYGKFDGLPSVECSGGYQPGCWRSRDGRLWFATVRGAVCVQPRELPFNPLPPPVVIEEVLVDGEVQGAKSEVRSAKSAGGRTEPPAAVARRSVEVGPGRHHLEIHYAGLSFTAPDRVRFKYRLAELEEEWIEAGTRRLATYNFIPPGEYCFEVLACNNDGVWSEVPAALGLVVRPYFWQTWWFKLAGALALVVGSGGLIGFYEWRRSRRKFERLQQHRALEQERARIAKDIHDDLGASLTRITLLSDSARSDPGDAAETGSALERIASTARDLTRAMDEIVWAVNPKHDRLDSLVNYLGKFAQDLLGDAGIAYRLEVPPQLPRWPVGAQARHNLFLAVKEALHNVVKHAKANAVRVTLGLERGRFVLGVADDGCGFAPDASSPRAAGGNGLANMQTRLQEIGGQCAVRSEPGGGTTVTFAVPVREE
jgi:signal transduction histidine kinase/ligand-binding sensor domain-containing protein